MKTLPVILSIVLLLFASAGSAQLPDAAQLAADRQELCRATWTSQGTLDQRLYAGCIAQQREALAELRLYQQRFSGAGFFSSYALPYCQRTESLNGVVDVQLLVFCLREEIDGYEEVQTYRRLYSGRRVNAVVNTALTDTGSWAIAAQRLKTVANLKMVTRL